MITGVVRDNEARIQLKVLGPRGQEQEFEAVIDTGYTAWLTLPRALIDELGLRWQSLEPGTLADGSEHLFDVYEGTVLWNRQALRIAIDEADTEPLVGMALLSGYELKIEVRSRGKVTVRRLPRTNGRRA
jgi:clan AA aspartic protease